MKRDEVLGIIRHVLTFAGALLASKGVAESADTETIAGGLLAVIAGIWSIYDKRKRGSGTGTPTPPPLAPAACLALLAGLLLGGCAGLNSAAYKGAATIESAVDQAMCAWADYVVWAEKQPNTSTAELLRIEGRVKIAFESYRASMDTAYAMRKAVIKGTAIESDYDAALAAAADAGSALTTLITTLSKGYP